MVRKAECFVYFARSTIPQISRTTATSTISHLPNDLKLMLLRMVPPLATAHTFIFGFLKEIAHLYNNIFVWFMTLGKSRSQQGPSESKRKIGGNHAFFRDN